MQTLQIIHGEWRWILALIAVIVIIKYAIGWLGQQSFSKLDHNLGRLFAGAMTIQFVLGLITILYKISLGATYRQMWEHAFTGVIAVGLAHMLPRFRKNADAARFRNSLLVVAIALALVLANVLLLMPLTGGQWVYRRTGG